MEKPARAGFSFPRHVRRWRANYFFISSVLVVDVVVLLSAGAGGVVAVVLLSAGAGAVVVVVVESAGAGAAIAGAGADVVDVVEVVDVVSSFLPHAVSEMANNDATSRVFFIISFLGDDERVLEAERNAKRAAPAFP